MALPPLTVAPRVIPDRRLYHPRKGGVASIQSVVLHHTGSRNEFGDINWLSVWHGSPEVSVHRVIRRNGVIVPIVLDQDVAYHAGRSRLRGREDVGAWSVGIEIAHSGSPSDLYPEIQQEAVAQTVAYLCALYRIPDKNVTTHERIRTEWINAHPLQARLLRVQPKDDPIRYPLDRFWVRIGQIRNDWPESWPPKWVG